MSRLSNTLKRKDAVFKLDKAGGAVILQQMSKNTIERVTDAIVRRANQISSANASSAYGVGAPNKRGGTRYYGRGNSNMSYPHAANFVSRYGNTLKDAGRKALK